MTGATESNDRAPPFGTGRRIRSRAAWAVALFTAAVPPAAVALGIARMTEDATNVARPLALGFWLLGFVFALAAAVPTLRYWDLLPGPTRWLGALPLLSVSLFLSVAMILALIV